MEPFALEVYAKLVPKIVSTAQIQTPVRDAIEVMLSLAQVALNVKKEHIIMTPIQLNASVLIIPLYLLI